MSDRGMHPRKNHPRFPIASRSAALIRLCQPWPVALKCSTTSWSSRRVTWSLVGFFCGPRWPGLRLGSIETRSDGSASAAGRNSFQSSSVNGRTSPDSFVSGFFFIITHCPVICFSETDNAHTPYCGSEAQGVQPIFQQAKCHHSVFRINPPVILGN